MTDESKGRGEKVREVRVRVLADVTNTESTNLIFRKGDEVEATYRPRQDLYWAKALDGARCFMFPGECVEVRA
jgi:hypothetical protein